MFVFHFEGFIYEPHNDSFEFIYKLSLEPIFSPIV